MYAFSMRRQFKSLIAYFALNLALTATFRSTVVQAAPVPKSIRSEAKIGDDDSILDPARSPASDDLAAPNERKSEPTPVTAPPAHKEPQQGGVRSLTRVVGEIERPMERSIERTIVTSREVQINDAIEQAVYGRPLGQTQIRVLQGTEKSFAKDVQTVLREWVIYLEAKSFESGDVSHADLQKALRAVQDNVSHLPAWQGLEPSTAEVNDILERKLISKKFLRLKTDSAQVPISDAEAMAYFKKNRLRFGNMPFTSFRENIKTFLIKQQMDRRLHEWLDVLERKYKVRNFIAG